VESEVSVQERLVLATITCIERDGIEAVGIREIAREAQVNSAAISYYFRSKDNLVAAALERTLESGFTDVLADLDRRLADGEEFAPALEEVLTELLGNTVRYPRITYAHLRSALVEQRYDGPALRKQDGFLEGLVGRWARASPGLPDGERRIAVAQIWSNLLLFGMLPRVFESFTGLDFNDEGHRRKWLGRLMRAYLPEPASPRPGARRARSPGRRPTKG
jgi:AcrR family transcriptional regulator